MEGANLMEVGMLFQRTGAATEKARLPQSLRLDFWVVRRPRSADLRVLTLV